MGTQEWMTLLNDRGVAAATSRAGAQHQPTTSRPTHSRCRHPEGSNPWSGGVPRTTPRRLSTGAPYLWITGRTGYGRRTAEHSVGPPRRTWTADRQASYRYEHAI